MAKETDIKIKFEAIPKGYKKHPDGSSSYKGFTGTLSFEDIDRAIQNAEKPKKEPFHSGRGRKKGSRKNKIFPSHIVGNVKDMIESGKAKHKHDAFAQKEEYERVKQAYYRAVKQCEPVAEILSKRENPDANFQPSFEDYMCGLKKDLQALNKNESPIIPAYPHDYVKMRYGEEAANKASESYKSEIKKWLKKHPDLPQSLVTAIAESINPKK